MSTANTENVQLKNKLDVEGKRRKPYQNQEKIRVLSS